MNRTSNTTQQSAAAKRGPTGRANPAHPAAPASAIRTRGTGKMLVAAATAAATLGVYALFGGSPAPTAADPHAGAPRADLIDAAFDRLLAQAEAVEARAADELQVEPPAPESDDAGWSVLDDLLVVGNPFAKNSFAAPEFPAEAEPSVAEAEQVDLPIMPLPPFDADAPMADKPSPDREAEAKEAMELLDALLTGEDTVAPEANELDVLDVGPAPATPEFTPVEPAIVPVAEPVEAVEPQVPVSSMPVSEAVSEKPPHDVEIIAGGQLLDGALLVTVNDSRIIETTRPFHRVAIAKDSLATIQPISPTQLLVTAHEAGTTQVVFWDQWDQSQTLLLQSGTDLRIVQQKLEEMLPGEDVRAVDLGGRIGLTGTVSNLAVAGQAARIGAAFGEVEDFMTIAGKQQVALKIRFAEVSRTAGKEFGVNFGFDDGTATIFGSNIGQVRALGFNDGATGIGIPDPNAGIQLFGLGSLGGDPFAYYLNALRDSNLLKMLAEPELVVKSGEEGEILAGGEYPVPVPQEEGVAIEYREFGVKLTYQPIVLGDGRIELRLATEVSDLDDSIGVSAAGTRVPGLSKRAAATVVELHEGQTLAIGGLLQSKAIASKSVVPILGDLPIIGAAFRSVRYSRQETELVIMITPHLVEALDEAMPAPGEKWHHPNDLELMVFGQLGGEAGVSLPDDADRGGRDNHAQGHPPHPRPGPRLESRYAFTPADE